MLARLSVFLGNINPALGEIWGIQLYIFFAVISLTALFLLGYLIQGTRVGLELWIAVRKIKALARTGANVEPAAIAAVLSKKPYDHLWGKYSDTLHQIRRSGDGPPARADVRATVPAEMFFTRDALVDARLFDDFARHLPGVLTGLGIIGTFAGLLDGLSRFDATSGTTAVAGLKSLLDGVAHAFTISAIAIACAMLVVFISKFALAIFYQQVQSLNHSIDTLYAPGAGEEYLSRLVESAENSSASAAELKRELVVEITRLLNTLSDKHLTANAHHTQALGRFLAEALERSLRQTYRLIDVPEPPAARAPGESGGPKVSIDAATRRLAEELEELEAPIAKLHIATMHVAGAAQDIQSLLARLRKG
jgi:hypothetical protein